MNEMYLESIDKTISFNGAIEEDNLLGINLSLLSDKDINILYMEAVGYAETLLMFEIDARENYNPHY